MAGEQKKSWEPWIYRNKFARYATYFLIIAGVPIVVSKLLQGESISIKPSVIILIVTYLFYARWREKKHAKEHEHR